MTLLNDSALDTLAKRIRTARLISGLRQGDLADAVGVSRSAVNEWEGGRTEPSATKMFAIARATGQPLDWFAEGANATTAPAEAEAVVSGVRPKGLEPLTF